MKKLKIEFIANDDISYASETEIGKQLGYITWGLSKLRVSFSDELKIGDVLMLSQEFFEIITKDLWKKEDNSYSVGVDSFISKFKEPKVVFYLNTDKESKSEKIKLNEQNIKNGFVDIYVGGLFQKEALYGGASIQKKDIKLIVEFGEEKASVSTMIRVRKNANELSTKAKKDYLQALSDINERDDAGFGLGIYTTDFFAMHVKGSKMNAHGDSMFLPWHRLYILDIERQLQIQNNNVSLHYWKFDEASPNIFQQDFLGKCINLYRYTPNTAGVTPYFARFNDQNPLKNWAIGREKLLRRTTLFQNQINKANGRHENDSDQTLMSEYKVLMNMGYVLGIPDYKNEDSISFTRIEADPHGSAHDSFNGFLNFVPTAAKDPLFYFLHSNVDRLWAKWQVKYKRFDSGNESYPYSFESHPNKLWKAKEATQWPWDSSRSEPESLLPPGTRDKNFTKSIIVNNFKENIPKIVDTLDAFGALDPKNHLGFEYDDVAAFLDDYVMPQQLETVQIKQNKLLSKLNESELLKLVKVNLNKDKGSEILDKLNEFLRQRTFNPETLVVSASSVYEFRKLTKFKGDDPDESKCIRDIAFIILAQWNDLDTKDDLENQYKLLISGQDQDLLISKYLIIYLLGINNHEYLQDDYILKFFNKYTIKKSNLKEELNLVITLLSFASNKAIKECYQILKPNMVLMLNPHSFISLKAASGDWDRGIEDTEVQKIDNLIWALRRLFTNAGVKTEI